MRLLFLSAVLVTLVMPSVGLDMERLKADLGEDGVNIFLGWAAHERAVESAVLEAMIANHRITDAQLLEVILQRFPNSLETEAHMRSRRLTHMLHVLQPVQFHDALVNSPLPLDPVTPELIAYLRTAIPGYDVKRHGAEAIAVWKQFCIGPLALFATGELSTYPCPQAVVADKSGRLTRVTRLSGEQIRLYLSEKLQRQQALL